MASVGSMLDQTISPVTTSSPLPSLLKHVTPAVTNSTAFSLRLPSPKDLFLMPLRIANRAEHFAFTTLPQVVIRGLGIDEWTRAASDYIGLGQGGEIAAAGAAEGAAAVAEVGGTWREGFVEAFGFQNIRSFGGMLSYMTSRFCFACFSVALILNRVTVYASSRHPITLSWDKRLALRLIPILLFFGQIYSLLQTMRCQTSSDYSSIRYGKPGKNMTLDYAGDGGFLYWLSSSLLFWEDDRQGCAAVHMTRPTKENEVFYGSFSLLWPVFIRLCLSHFVETISCSLQGRPVMTETGMSIFEHSLAFAEAETMVSHSIGLGLFGLPKPSTTKHKNSTVAQTDNVTEAVALLSRGYVLDRLNVPPEVLLIALISCCNSLSSQILAVLGKQSRYRLLNTTLWGLCFMSAFVWGFFNISTSGGDAGFLRFPTICIVGFIPHLLILIGIFICVFIYTLALVLTALSLPGHLPQPISLRERLVMAHENLIGSAHIRNIRFSMHEDFYNALLKVGFTALTVASEAVFLNEGRSVQVRRFTWLEEERLDEIEAARIGRHRGSGHSLLETGEDFAFDFEEPLNWESGYAREKKIEKVHEGPRTVQPHGRNGGVGALQRSSRTYLVFAFFRGIFLLMVRWWAMGFNKMLDRMGITVRPRWLTRLAGRSGKSSTPKVKQDPDTLDFWILTDEGQLELPEDDDIDVAAETKKRLLMEKQDGWSEPEQNELDSRLYKWWMHGGWWGAKDESGDYQPSEDDNDFDDTTSIISISTNSTTDSDWEDYEGSSGRRTPTQADPYPISSTELHSRSRSSTSFSRSPSPLADTTLNSTYLARLLNPHDAESRQEARILSSHLAANRESGDGIITRSRFQRELEMERSKVLTSTRLYHPNSTESNKTRRPTPAEEAEILEQLILSRRSGPSSTATQQQQPSTSAPPPSSSWDSGASGLGPSGPQCVVCQAAPRTIIAWPCRCLCLCEECRVSLAMNNFGNCVTCRREVGGFVRLWVP